MGRDKQNERKMMTNPFILKFMAIIKSKFWRALSGKIGELVFCYIKGRQYLRQRPRRGNQETQPAQLLQMNRMRACVSFYHANMDTPIPDIWKLVAREVISTGYNLFVKANIRLFDMEHRIGDYSRLQLTCGVLEMPYEWSIRRVDPDHVQLKWCSSQQLTEERQNDRLQAFWLRDNGSFDIEIFPLPDIRRGAQEAVLPLPADHETDWHLYLYFANKEKSAFSGNKYFFIENEK